MELVVLIESLIVIILIFILFKYRLNKKAQQALVETEVKYRNLVEDTLVGIYIIQDGKVVYVNDKLIEMLDYSEEELIGLDALDFVIPEDRVLLGDNLKKRMKEESSSLHYQYRAVKKDKTVIHVEVIGSETIYQGKPALMGSVLDITNQKIAKEAIEYLAYHDTLTGLYNRHHFYNQLHLAITNKNTQNLAVLFFDLDRFKFINDSMGHGVGDRLLKAVSEKLKNSISNQIGLARYGGDEFIISLPKMNRQEVSDFAEHLLACFADPFYIDQYELFITPSIGISLYPKDGKDVEALIKKADIALYEAKQKGKNTFQFYRSKQLENLNDRLELEAELRKALEQEEFQLHYQPKLDLTTGKISGVEALIRWKHPEKGLISPAEFIPLAEESGLILPIGEWALRAACMQNKAWREAGLPPFVVSVNLSVRQLYQPDLVGMVKRILAGTGLEPKYLELEITESTLMDTEQGLKVLKELKGIGIQISLDDFGTGYSSLYYLREFPIDKLKIDQSFIRNCAGDKSNAAIVKTIIAMAHQLKIEVVAEGVELKEHLVFLQRNLCNKAQGYLFSKPLPPNEFIERFADIEQIIDLTGIPQESFNNRWMEEALKIARQELLDTIRQQQGMTFKIIEKNGKFIHSLCDGELLYRMGLIPEQIIGKELKDFFSVKDAEEKIQYYRKAWHGEENVSYEGKINGIHYIASLRPIRKGGQVVEVIGSCVDITERKQIEEALKLSEANYRLIAENMLDLVGVWDVNGKVKYASPSHETILGYSPKEYEGKSAFDLIHPDDLPRVQEQFSYICSTKMPCHFEFRCTHSDGEWVYVEAKGSPVVDVDGEVEHFVFVGRDITDFPNEKAHAGR